MNTYCKNDFCSEYSNKSLCNTCYKELFNSIQPYIKGCLTRIHLKHKHNNSLKLSNYVKSYLTKLEYKPIFQLNLQKRLFMMTFFKNKAKIYYNNSKLEDSLINYKKALDYLLDDTHIDKIKILTNLSIISGKICDWENSLYFSQQAFNIEQTPKVLYRLALSCFNLEQYSDCIEICNHENFDITLKSNLLKQCKNKINLQKKKEVSFCKKMFV